MKYFGIDFEDDIMGIAVMAENEEEARKKAENPANWKDGRPRKISRIWEEED